MDQDLMDQFAAKLDDRAYPTDDVLAQREEHAKQLRWRQHVANCIRRLNADLSARHREATLDNFACKTDQQRAVLLALRKIAGDIRTFIDGGNQLFFYGSVGSGKDHLAVSLLRLAARQGYSVRWRQAIDLYDRLAFAKENGETQPRIYEQLLDPEILCLSDPVFDRNWTPAKADALAKIVRRRHDRAGRTTWVTINVDSLDQARELLYPDVYDRLIERATAVRCWWPSYRPASMKTI